MSECRWSIALFAVCLIGFIIFLYPKETKGVISHFCSKRLGEVVLGVWSTSYGRYWPILFDKGSWIVSKFLWTKGKAWSIKMEKCLYMSSTVRYIQKEELFLAVRTLEVTSGLDGYQDLLPFSLKGNFKEDGKPQLIGRNWVLSLNYRYMRTSSISDNKTN